MTRVTFRPEISPRITEPSAIHTGPSGNPKPVAMMRISGISYSPILLPKTRVPGEGRDPSCNISDAIDGSRPSPGMRYCAIWLPVHLADDLGPFVERRQGLVGGFRRQADDDARHSHVAPPLDRGDILDRAEHRDRRLGEAAAGFGQHLLVLGDRVLDVAAAGDRDP